jgi:uncharacterized membrane protein YqgA involved in biofilm formation
MIGAVINAAGIVAGGGWALGAKKPLPNRYQLAAKGVLGVFTVWFGLQLTWRSLNGSFRQILKELCLLLLAMVLGKLIGRILRLQEFSNSVGQFATRSLSGSGEPRKASEGFLVATGLFCVGPLAVLASVQEGLDTFSPLFWVKAGTDGLATMAFCATFGWSAILSAIPVLAVEVTLIRLVECVEPYLRHQPQPLVDAINATDGLLIFCVALIILEIKKVRVAEYLPSLALAPLLTRWLW